jgi:hypothetical protein
MMKSSLDPIERLTHTERSAMRALLDRHFEGVDDATFAADLGEKSHALRLFDDLDTLVGFSTIDYRRRPIEGRPAAVLYSGDTIVDPAVWSAASLGATWITAVMDLHHSAGPQVPLWWLLLTSGMRTYRYLPVFFLRYHPASPDRDDVEASRLLPQLAHERFGGCFNSSTGIVSFPRPQRLRRHLTLAPSHHANDEHAKRFLAANPGHENGDELVSLCRLDLDNFTTAGNRAFEHGMRAAALSKR